MGRPRRALVTACGAALALLASLGCHSSDPAPAPDRSDPSATASPDAFRPAPLAWTGCAPNGFECASLDVPLDYGQPQGARITLAVKRHPAGGSDRIGSLFLNPGGPGAMGTEALTGLVSAFDPAVVERFDLVSWDPRGVGASAPLTCERGSREFFAHDLGAVDPGVEADRAAQAWADLCRQENGAVLPFLGTRDVALDLESLRRAAGDEPLTYAGFSYGTEIGLVYAELFPRHLRALLLDGVADLSQDVRTATIQQAAAIEKVLDKFVAWCNSSAGCPLRPDAGAALDRLYALAGQGRLEGTIGRDRQRLSRTQVNFGITMATYGQDRWPELAAAVAAALTGDGQPIATLAGRYLDLASFSAFTAVTCLDVANPTGGDFDRMVADAVRVAPRTGAYNVNAARPCEHWPTPPKPLPTHYRAAGAPMVEVWGTTGDNATPYENAVHVAGLLERARLVTLDADRHVAFAANACVTRWQTAYLVDLEVPPEGTRC